MYDSLWNEYTFLRIKIYHKIDIIKRIFYLTNLPKSHSQRIKLLSFISIMISMIALLNNTQSIRLAAILCRVFCNNPEQYRFEWLIPFGYKLKVIWLNWTRSMDVMCANRVGNNKLIVVLNIEHFEPKCLCYCANFRNCFFIHSIVWYHYWTRLNCVTNRDCYWIGLGRPPAKEERSPVCLPACLPASSVNTIDVFHFRPVTAPQYVIRSVYTSQAFI